MMAKSAEGNVLLAKISLIGLSVTAVLGGWLMLLPAANKTTAAAPPPLPAAANPPLRRVSAAQLPQNNALPGLRQVRRQQAAPVVRTRSSR
ncbi:hypothetical protein [Paralysiella testudinis]|uniref:Uncharacterized protein n=1 Tax=Paralysiella testudinis TaxID=2809020 RepID=A0A892ZJZ4_9NEIS|nr:hypothetical protein [Paralysiella testudinis]QRQ81874.1 hypothetical protein JQU52_14650 [Paralysiella testudinis]